MAGIATKESIQKIKDATPIDEIVSKFVLLKRASGGTLIGLCPFHDEKTPSFHVKPSNGYWHCFGCGEGGDVFSFIQKMNSMSFGESLEYIAGLSGVKIEYQQNFNTFNNEKNSKESKISRSRLIEANNKAHNFFLENMQKQEQDSPAKQFMHNKGFTNGHIEQFQVGYALNDWQKLLEFLRKSGFSTIELQETGLFKTGQNNALYDSFRDRVMWAIRDLTGDIVGFSGRQLSTDQNNSGGKYINTPATSVFNKSNLLFYGYESKKAISAKQEVVIVEGQTDVMACQIAGIETAVATCGTAFGENHVRIIRRLIGDYSNDYSSDIKLPNGNLGGRIVWTFDGDQAGQKAAIRTVPLAQNITASCLVATMPKGKDPCDVRLEKGEAELVSLINSAMPMYEFILKTIITGTNLETTEGRASALEQSAIEVAKIKDLGTQNEYAQKIAKWIGIDEQRALEQVNKAKYKLRSQSINENNQIDKPTQTNKENIGELWVNASNKEKQKQWELEKIALAAIIQFIDYSAIPITSLDFLEQQDFLSFDNWKIFLTIQKLLKTGNFSNVETILEKTEKAKQISELATMQLPISALTENSIKDFVNFSANALAINVLNFKIRELKKVVQKIGNNPQEITKKIIELQKKKGLFKYE